MSCLACGSENVKIQGEVIAHAIENGGVVHKILHAVECLDCATVNNVEPPCAIIGVPEGWTPAPESVLETPPIQWGEDVLRRTSEPVLEA